MGTFVTQETTPVLFEGGAKVAADLRYPQGLSNINLPRAADLNNLQDGLQDVRTELRGLVYNAKHYGVVGDGATDDTSAAQDFIDMVAAVNGVAYFPGGNYRLTGGLVVDDVRGFTLCGAGPQFTRFTWDGASGEDMLTVINSQLVHVHGFELRGNSAALKRPRSCLRSAFESAAYTYVTAKNRFKDIWCGAVGSSTGLPNMCQYGVLVSADTADLNNSEHVWEGVHVDGAELAGVSIQQTQAKTLKFYDCHVDVSSVGVDCQDGAFSWYGGAINCVLASKEGIMFEIGSPNDPILIEGVQSEGTGRILRTNGGTPLGAGWPVTIRNSRIAGNLANPDGVMIDFVCRGPLEVYGNTFDSWDPVSGTPLQFNLTSSAGVTAVDVRNNFVSGTNTYQNSLIKSPAALGVRENGNVYVNTGGATNLQRKHSGSIDFVNGDTTKSWTFDVPVHTGAAGAQIYTVATSISERTGTSAQVSKVTKSATGFDVTLTAALGPGETLTVDWQLEWK